MILGQGSLNGGPQMMGSGECAPSKLSCQFVYLLYLVAVAHGKKDVRLELSDDESQHFSPAEPSESDLRSIDEPTNSPVGNDVNDDLSPPARCPMVLNNRWLHDSEKALVSKRSTICIVFSVSFSSGRWISVLSFEMAVL